jgi:2-oxoisovalerate ferredoxin oxidoreductase alpha subunit
VPKQLIKGNEAIVKAAILAGCRSYYGYPITPASEVAEAASFYFPRCGGTFIQAESEVAAINMCYGAAAAGERTMTASSGPGVSLMQEGLSYSSCAELPIVVADVARAGPGLGNLGPEQGDYNQVVKGGGHGNYRLIVLAPASCQEMCDLTLLAFELADRYRNPALLLTEGFCGQMMEPVEFPAEQATPPDKTSWCVGGDAETRHNVVRTDLITFDELEGHLEKLQAKYAELEEKEVRFEGYRLDDAEVVGIAFGTVSRILRSAVDQAREQGLKVGLLRLITLYPFPTKRIAELAAQGRSFLVVELSNGQMVQDVRLAVDGRAPVTTHLRMGGHVPSQQDLVDALKEAATAR